MWKAKVKWNGNHYFKDQEVTGTKLNAYADGKIELFDDEEYYMIINGHKIDVTRYEWVEIQPDTLVSATAPLRYGELVSTLSDTMTNNPYQELIQLALNDVKAFEEREHSTKPTLLSEEDRGQFRMQYDHSCSSCEEYIQRSYKYCPYCGKLIDWDALPADKTI